MKTSSCCKTRVTPYDVSFHMYAEAMFSHSSVLVRPHDVMMDHPREEQEFAKRRLGEQ